MTKHCKKCGLEKDLLEFGNSKTNRDRRMGSCKECEKVRQRIARRVNKYWDCKKYEKTHNGFVMRMYRNMKSRINGVQKQKFHLYNGKELLDKQMFYDWILTNPEFFRLFEIYKNNNYDRKLAPSVDRINSDLGYYLENMEVITHSENSRRGNISRFLKRQNSINERPRKKRVYQGVN